MIHALESTLRTSCTIFEDHEAAIINLKSGNYYSLDPVGAFVWAHVERGASTGEIVEEILTHYDGESGDVTRELVRFLDALQAEELIVSRSEPSPGRSRSASNQLRTGTGAKFLSPRPSSSVTTICRSCCF